MHLFVLIKDLLRFVCEFIKQNFGFFFAVLPYLLQAHYKEVHGQSHKRLCKIREPALMMMPTAKNGSNKYKLKNTYAIFYAPFVFCFELESFLKPLRTRINNSQISLSRVLKKIHDSSGYSMVANDRESSEPFSFVLIVLKTV